MWRALTSLRFTGGAVLEPGSGAGTFIGLAPEGAELTGVELDPLTAAISRGLYPDATIRTESFADTRLPEEYFDAVIGNVPFSHVILHDPVHNSGRHSMHNHFIIKSLALTRPGGLVAVLTSRYTLDAENDAARHEMHARADLLPAVRLPSGQPQIVVGQASQPALSRDGKRLAFRSWDKAQRGILVHEMVDGHIWTWVSYSEAARPSWGPDNQAIVFASQQESDRNWRLYRTLGLEIDRVRRHGGDIYGRVPAWLADGRIVYWECPEDKCGLYLMQGDGTSPVRLTMAEHDLAPSASPDGSRVAFMSNRDGNWEVYVVDIARPEGPQGQGLVRITRDSARDGLPTWSPDGRWLAFVSVSYTHLRAHETVLDLVCRLLLEKKKKAD